MPETPETATARTRPELSAEIRAQVKEIVFGTQVARSLEVEAPAVIVQVTAERIWGNLAAYFVTGDWPDRRRTAAEIDAEDAEAGRRERP